MEIRYPANNKEESLGVLSQAPYTRKMNKSNTKCAGSYIFIKSTLNI